VNLLRQGLVATIAREVPSYAIYFVMYAFLSQLLAPVGPILQPLIAGGLSGMGSWLPVYPIDVVKTGVQMSESTKISSLEVALKLYDTGGVLAFFDGLGAKMARACVNHGVTFFIYSKLYPLLM